MQIINFILVYSVVFFTFEVFHFFSTFAYDINFSGDDMQVESSEGIMLYCLLYILRSWICFEKFQKKDLDLEEVTASVKSLVDKDWALEGVAVEHWKVFAIHYQNIGVYNVLQTTFLLFLLFMHEMGFNIMQMTTKWWRQRCPLAISSSP